MSSPKAAVAKAARRPRQAVRTTAAPNAGADLSADATRLAAALEQALAAGRHDAVADEALQALMAALCRTYGAQVEAGRQVLPLKDRTSVTSTDVMTTASGLLRSANLAVFELGMWQSWTGR